jgi:hypothetical protein
VFKMWERLNELRKPFVQSAIDGVAVAQLVSICHAKKRRSEKIRQRDDVAIFTKLVFDVSL